MASSEEIVKIALHVLPDQATLVPEKRQEITTEGGLDVFSNRKTLAGAILKLKAKGIKVSLFVDPVAEVIKSSKKIGADAVELHTGSYANARPGGARDCELAKLKEAANLAAEEGLEVIAGHGLTYTNILPVKTIEQLEEVNIGHSIVSRAVLVGIERAVREMKELLTL